MNDKELVTWGKLKRTLEHVPDDALILGLTPAFDGMVRSYSECRETAIDGKIVIMLSDAPSSWLNNALVGRGLMEENFIDDDGDGGTCFGYRRKDE